MVPAGSGQRRFNVALVLVVAVALAWRVWGLDFGLPYLYHPDEPDKIAMAQRMFITGDPNPHYFRKPTLVWYLNAAAYVPYYLIQRQRGVLQSRRDLRPPEMLAMGVGKSEQPSTVLLGRALTALIGGVVVLLTALLARQVGSSPGAALLAASLVAFSPTAAWHSRYISVDMFAVAAILAVALASLAVLTRGRPRDYIVAGALVGLAAGCKYPAALAGIMLLTAHFVARGRRGWRDGRLWLGLLVAPLAFLITTPYAVLEHQQFLFEARHEADHYMTVGHAGMEGESAKWYAVYGLRVEGVYLPLGVAALVLAWRRRARRWLILAAFVAFYLMFISVLVVRNDRTLLPVLPFLAIAAAWLLGELWMATARARDRRRQLVTGLAAALLTALAVGQVVAGSVAEARQLSGVDTRRQATEWLSRNLPPGSTVALEAYAPWVDPRRFNVLAVTSLAEMSDEWFEKNEVEYAVFGEGMYGRYVREPRRYPSQFARYQALFSRFCLIKEFADGDFDVRVFQVAPAGQCPAKQ